MPHRVDARGLSCPQPVGLTQKALQDAGNDVIEVIVDNACSLENVTRFARSKGCAVETAPLSHAEAEGEGVDGCYIIRITPRAGAR